MTSLFSEYKIKNFTINNRIVLPPMVNFGWSDTNGLINEKHVQHYEARARGGVGLIIVEALAVNKNGKIFDLQPGIWSDEHTEGLSKIAEACHRHGAVILAQIHHAGLKTFSADTLRVIGPSNSQVGKREGFAMTTEELHNLQDDFVKAAIRAKTAGYDGIELHGAHGYLLNQFSSPEINKREDEYGGNMDNRLRFIKEIIVKMKKEIDSEFIIGYRMGANEPTLEGGITLAGKLEKLGVDLLHVSSSEFSKMHPSVPEGFDYNWIVYSGTDIKKHVSIPVIVVNQIKTPERAAYLVENGLADFVAIGKDMLTDAEWANKARDGKEIAYCMKCRPRCRKFEKVELCPRF